MVPSPDETALAFAAFGTALKVLLVSKYTPKIFRDKLVRVAAEFRDGLAGDLARMVDGAEAELVISAYAGILQSPQLDENCLPNRQQSGQRPDELKAKSDGT